MSEIGVGSKVNRPTNAQLNFLRALLPAGVYLEYRFDLGGCIVRNSGDGKVCACGPSISTAEACEKRGWITHTIHRFGTYTTEIERRYVITDKGRTAAK